MSLKDLHSRRFRRRARPPSREQVPRARIRPHRLKKRHRVSEHRDVARRLLRAARREDDFSPQPARARSRRAHRALDARDPGAVRDERERGDDGRDARDVDARGRHGAPRARRERHTLTLPRVTARRSSRAPRRDRAAVDARDGDRLAVRREQSHGIADRGEALGRDRGERDLRKGVRSASTGTARGRGRRRGVRRSRVVRVLLDARRGDVRGDVLEGDGAVDGDRILVAIVRRAARVLRRERHGDDAARAPRDAVSVVG